MGSQMIAVGKGSHNEGTMQTMELQREAVGEVCRVEGGIWEVGSGREAARRRDCVYATLWK